MSFKGTISQAESQGQSREKSVTKISQESVSTDQSRRLGNHKVSKGKPVKISQDQSVSISQAPSVKRKTSQVKNPSSASQPRQSSPRPSKPRQSSPRPAKPRQSRISHSIKRKTRQAPSVKPQSVKPQTSQAPVSQEADQPPMTKSRMRLGSY
nr:RNA-binding protein with serine-rich domain 1-like [Penaeus vannamei]